MKNSKFGLKNFRVFDEKGAEFDMAPITLITGANSSGKSSVFKSLMLLNETLGNAVEKYITDRIYNPLDFKLEFHKGKHNLGAYDKAKSNFSKSNQMIFTYEKHSNFIMDDIKVNLYFSKDEDDFLKNGVLEKVEIFKEDDLLFELFEISELGSGFRVNIDSLALKPHFISLLKSRKELVEAIRHALEKPEVSMRRKGMPLADFMELVNYNTHYSYETEDQLYSAFVSKDFNQLLKRYYDVKRNIADINGSDELLKLKDKLNYGDLSQLIYLPFSNTIDTSKGNIVESFNNSVLDKKSEKKYFNDDELTLVNAFLNEFIESEYADIHKFFTSITDRFVEERLSQINYYKNIGFMSSSDISKDNIFDKVRDKVTLIPPHTMYQHNCILLDTSTVNSRRVQEDMEVGGLKKVFEGVRDYELINALFNVFANLDEDFFKNRDDFIVSPLEDFYYGYYKPLEFEMFLDFIMAFLQDCFINLPSFLKDNVFVDAVRVNVQRSYTYKSQGTDFNVLLLDYLTKRKDNSSGSYQLGTFVNKWIKEFDVAEEIIFEPTEDGLGVLISIVKGGDKILLADEGYGITQLVSILLQIELNIFKSPYNYSQEFVSGSETRFKESTISIEEPEVNLHPKFQSKLAEMFIDAYKSYNVRFILETHSEYLIRKLQAMVAKKEIKADDVSINYIYNHDESKRPEGVDQVIKIGIEEDGSLDKSFGSGFFDEADNLAMDLLTLKFLN